MVYLGMMIAILMGCKERTYFPKTNPCADHQCQIDLPNCIGASCQRPEIPSCPEGEIWVPEKAKCQADISKESDRPPALK